MTSREDRELLRQYLHNQQLLEEMQHRRTGYSYTQGALAMMRYLGVRFALHAAVYPFESTVLLRQISAAYLDAGSGDYDIVSDTRVDNVDEYEEYLLRPSPSLSRSLHEHHVANPVWPADSDGYVRRPADASLLYPVHLDKRASLWSSLGKVGRQQGVMSMYRGYSAHYWHSIASDALGSVASEIITAIPVVDRWLARIELSPAGPPLLSACASALVHCLLTPLEVAKIRMLLGSSAQRDESIRGALGQSPRWYPNIILGFVSRFASELFKSAPSLLLESLVSRHPWNTDNFWVQCGLILAEASLLNCTLLLSMPLETIRARLVASACIHHRELVGDDPRFRLRIPQMSARGFWQCFQTTVKEEGVGALYQGWAFRALQNGLRVASDWLLHLNEHLLMASEEEDF